MLKGFRGINFFLLLIYILLVNQALSFRFSVIHHHSGSLTRNNQKKTDQNIEETHIEPLRSYKPHFLHSYSYPSVSTAHWFYGQVLSDHPRFYIKDSINSTQKVEQILTVNSEPDNSTYLIADEKKSGLSIYKYMLSLQIENQKIDEPLRNYSIYLDKNENFYALIARYNNISKQYLLYFSLQEEQKVISLAETEEMGMEIFIRQEAANDPEIAWRLPLNMRWKGMSEQLKSNYKGIVFELTYPQGQTIQSVKIHLKEIYTHIQGETKNQTMARLLQTKIDSSFWNSKVKQQSNENNRAKCAQDAVKKLKAGMSYEYGTLQVINGSKTIQNNALPLLSFSPSRTRFPWGFLWDDGFHCQVAARDQPQLALKVVKSWLDTMMDNGWIPRQQNRGSEREFLCNCPRFMKKDIRDGNPPTLMLSLAYLTKNKLLNTENFPPQYWNKLEKWHSWFMNTQQSTKQGLVFSWHDSILNNGSFNSGLDDFPRLLGTQGHVDIQAWMYFFSDIMEDLYPIFTKEIGNPYSMFKTEIQSKLIMKYVDPNDWICKDFGKNSTFSTFIGYPSLLPIAFGMLEFSSKPYNGTIQLLKKRMDTGHGISSITTDSPFYLQNSNAYWRGPVWININYLVLRGLFLYYPGQKQLYKKLREDILNTVCGNWEKSGYFYENYINGRGSFSFPFNGWTSWLPLLNPRNID